MTIRDRFIEGGSAFPGGHGTEHGPEAGMTLRDYFAAAAMQAIISKSPGYFPDERTEKEQRAALEAIAGGAYDYADAMLKEREPQHSRPTEKS